MMLGLIEDANDANDALMGHGANDANDALMGHGANDANDAQLVRWRDTANDKEMLIRVLSSMMFFLLSYRRSWTMGSNL